jgi:hypothetical protein
MTGSPNNGPMNALAFNSAGVLFGSDFAGGGAGGAANLVTINTTTGVITNVGSTIAGLDAIAFRPAAAVAVVPVPTLSEWATIALAMLMLVFAGRTLRRHRR